MNDWLYEDEDGEIWRLGEKSKLMMAKWICAAYEWGGFDWNLICAPMEILEEELRTAAVDARWALAHFIHEQGLAEELVGGFEPETFYDDELGEWEETTPEGVIAVILCWFIASVRDIADNNGVTPTDVLNAPLRYVPPAQEAA